MQIIYPVFGLKEFENKTITEALIIDTFGEPDSVINHNGHTNELVYSRLGISVYFFQDHSDFDPEEWGSEDKFIEYCHVHPGESDDLKYMIERFQDEQYEKYVYTGRHPSGEFCEIHFFAPFQGKTEEGIILSRTLLRDAASLKQNMHSGRSVFDDDLWLNFKGIAFRVQHDMKNPVFPINQEHHFEKVIIEIKCGKNVGG